MFVGCGFAGKSCHKTGSPNPHRGGTRGRISARPHGHDHPGPEKSALPRPLGGRAKRPGGTDVRRRAGPSVDPRVPRGAGPLGVAGHLLRPRRHGPTSAGTHPRDRCRGTRDRGARRSAPIPRSAHSSGRGGRRGPGPRPRRRGHRGGPPMASTASWFGVGRDAPGVSPNGARSRAVDHLGPRLDGERHPAQRRRQPRQPSRTGGHAAVARRRHHHRARGVAQCARGAAVVGRRPRGTRSSSRGATRPSQR
jgi:hypothetical protein